VVADETLYQRVMAGDRGALSELVGRYHSPLCRFLYRHTGDRMLADDLVQETFARLLTHQGAPPERFRAWIYTIAANLARDAFRSAYHRREQADPFDSDELVAKEDAAQVRPLDEGLDRETDRRQVLDALLQLSPDHRAVVILRFYHELPLDEIATITGTPLGTVKSRLYYALKQLKGTLEREVIHD
jgi:RNA polymerase sigma-70 factor (ECF subfamily)